jgi:hypothetical protein
VHLEFAPKYQLRFLSGSFETLVWCVTNKATWNVDKKKRTPPSW